MKRVSALVFVAALALVACQKNDTVKQAPPAAPHTQTGSQQTAAINQEDSFRVLSAEFAKRQGILMEECPSSRSCFKNIFSSRDQIGMAQAYGIITSSTHVSDPGVKIGLLKGSSVTSTGIGKKELTLADERWYWELGACSDNKRIFIDAVTGNTTVIHGYIYCKGAK